MRMRRIHQFISQSRIVGVGLVAVVLLALGACRPVTPPAPAVGFYGDSLGSQAQPYVAAALAAGGTRVDLQSHTFGGQALCDYTARILEDIATRRVAVAVLEFAGNNLTACMRDGSGASVPQGSAEFANRYRQGMRAIFLAAAANGTKVVWATGPPEEGSTVAEDLTAIAREEAAGLAGITVAPTGAALTEDGVTFIRTLPCYPDEIGRGCGSDSRITVRNDDGLHLADAYSPGGRRFGEAIAAAALTALRS
jgi:hypothetical protein